MTDPPSELPKKTLNVPAAPRAHYRRNFIQSAVCELRFPTVLELEKNAPLEFSKHVRKEYPKYTRQKNLDLLAGGLEQATGHLFQSKNGRWTVTVRAAAISLQTSNYDSYDEFRKRLAFVLSASKSTIDSEFFTRIGLRYVNAVPFSPEAIRDWVNPELIGVLAAGTYGSVTEHWQRVRGITEIGGYTFQHGISQSGEAALASPAANGTQYVLDFDFFKEDVDFEEAACRGEASLPGVRDVQVDAGRQGSGASGRFHAMIGGQYVRPAERRPDERTITACS
jgi:uncharacterized protein (TIGR04255 family)